MLTTTSCSQKTCIGLKQQHLVSRKAAHFPRSCQKMRREQFLRCLGQDQSGLAHKGMRGCHQERILGGGQMAHLGLKMTAEDSPTGGRLPTHVQMRLIDNLTHCVAMMSLNVCFSPLSGGILTNVTSCFPMSATSVQQKQRPPMNSLRTVLATASTFLWIFQWRVCKVQRCQALR